MKFGFPWCSLLIGMAFGSLLDAETPSVIEEDTPASALAWIFDGQLTQMDSALAPTLREGLSVSGFVELEMAASPEDSNTAEDTAQYEGVVLGAECLFDLNHALKYECAWDGSAGLVQLARANESAEREHDFYGFAVPMSGEPIGEEGWTARWLQIWLYAEAGALKNIDFQEPPETVTSAWFRIAFWDRQGAKEIFAEGPLNYLAPEGEPLDPTAQVAQLESVVADLSSRLEASQSEVGRLNEELRKARARIDGMNKTIDGLIADRTAIQGELSRAASSKEEADATLVATIAELETERVRLEDSVGSLTTINEQLAHSIQRKESELGDASRKINRLNEELKSLKEQVARSGTGMRPVELLEEPVPDSPHPYLAPGNIIMEASDSPVIEAEVEQREEDAPLRRRTIRQRRQTRFGR